eukprot:TRINITY_DN4276_c0_g1_i1.p1 TRINITY_DN4276_c0_g1~~TRINITY_DN4276_c0_g1_i1.p1  ORF type:complete len:213 (+),score=57.00 TRINITY_DN4276_c0_g1_i1:81-641(+)
MGGALSALFGRMRRPFGPRRRQVRALMWGLDAAGKTTILYKLKLGEVVTTIPTIGFNVETLEHRDFTITAWDVGGKDKIRPLWRHYFQGTDVLIVVVDSNDTERMPQAREEMMRALNDDLLRGVPILCFANKQDLPNAMRADTVEELMGLEALEDRRTHCQPSCATTGDGLYEGLDWIASILKESS